MQMFTINGKEYKTKVLGLNAQCSLQEMGVDLSYIYTKTTLFMRAYLSYCSGLSLQKAGDELEAHIVNGGDLEEFSGAILKEIEASDFFQKLIENVNKMMETESAEA